MRRAANCGNCGRVAASIEVVAPGDHPTGWWRWSRSARQTFRRHREPGTWYRRVRVPGGSNGLLGDPIANEQVDHVVAAMSAPSFDPEVLDLTNGFCESCAVHFCVSCWNVSETGYGHCPHGHGAIIDPHARSN